MLQVRSQDVLKILNELNIKAGDGLLVHSALQFLGRPVGGIGMYLDALCEAVNCDPNVLEEFGLAGKYPAKGLSRNAPIGTIVVPTFNFAFARGEAYDPQSTPAQGMGIFSEYVRQQPAALRTLHPMQSLAVIGRYAVDLATRDTPSAFEQGSAFERMLELDFKILLLGADIDAISMFHYSEQRLNVPYRFWKEFSGLVKAPAGWEERTYRMYARDLEIDPQLTLHSVGETLQSTGKFYSKPLNYGSISLVGMEDFVSAVDLFLARDPYSLMINRDFR